LVLNAVVVFGIGVFFFSRPLCLGFSPRAFFLGSGLPDVPFVDNVSVLAWPGPRPESSRAIVRA
jgi:hypothetical protein